MFAVGLSQGPPHHYWYVWLDRLIPRKDIRAVLFKILLDQVCLVLNVFFNILLEQFDFFSSHVSTVEGGVGIDLTP